VQDLSTGRAGHFILVNKYDFFRTFVTGNLALTAVNDVFFGYIFFRETRLSDHHCDHFFAPFVVGQPDHRTIKNTFMAANSLDGILTWIGWPILIVGMLTVSIVLILLIVSPSHIHDWFADAHQNPTNNPYALDLLSSLTMAFVQDVLGRWLFLSGIFSLLGGGFLVLTLWLRRLKGQ